MESFEGNENEKKKERKQLCAKLKELEKEKNWEREEWVCVREKD